MGDTTYGDNAQNRAVAAHTGCTRLLLHARQLAFARLSDGARVNVAAGWRRRMEALMQAFGWAE